MRTLSTRETDPMRSELTAYLPLRSKTDTIGDEEMAHVIIPRERAWRTSKND